MTDEELARLVHNFTMTHMLARANTCWAVEHVINAAVPGAFVECGVYLGGSCMLAAYKMLQLGHSRDIWLFDTFTGMTKPTAADERARGPALPQWEDSKLPDGTNAWCRGDLQQVQDNLHSTGYPKERLHFCQGPVEVTLPRGDGPDSIAVLRIDTDFYESTKACLKYLYPRLQPGGVLILDDYGHWYGAAKAVDEYFDSIGRRPELTPVVDCGAAYCVKAAV